MAKLGGAVKKKSFRRIPPPRGGGPGPLPGPRRGTTPPTRGGGGAGTGRTPTPRGTTQPTVGGGGAGPTTPVDLTTIPVQGPTISGPTTPIDISTVPITTRAAAAQKGSNTGAITSPVADQRGTLPGEAIPSIGVDPAAIPAASPEAVLNLVNENGLEGAPDNPATTNLILSSWWRKITRFITEDLGITGELALLAAFPAAGKAKSGSKAVRGLVKQIGKKGPKAGVLKDFPLTKPFGDPGGELAITRQAVGGVGQRALAARIATNPATKKLNGKLLTIAGFTIAGAMVVKSMIESFSFAGFLKTSEGISQNLVFGRGQALAAGDMQLVAEIDQLIDEIRNPTGWDAVTSKLPWLAPFPALGGLDRTVDLNIKAQDKRVEHDLITGGDYLESQKLAQAEKKANEEEIVNYYNSQRKLMVLWETEAKTAERAAKREDEKKARNEDAEFWADQRKIQRELEAEDRIEIANFWTAYRKMAAIMAENTRPSNLNFGLL